MAQASFATFWHGGVFSPYEKACLLSFVQKGCPVTVYSYDPALETPSPVQKASAADIVDPSWIDRFPLAGKPCIAHFTDYFRLKMFERTDHIWIDADVFCLKPFAADRSGFLLGREDREVLCNAVMKLPRDEKLQALITKIESMAGQNLRWGETGPKALTAIYGDKILKTAHPPQTFYPIHYESYFMPFLPEHRRICEDLCAYASTIHLWNHLLSRTGLFKEIGPPEGSYLHHLFTGVNGASFEKYYPESVMKTLVYNAVNKIGRDAGIRRVLPFIRHGILNSLKRRLK
jgi:hypothetical protein